MPSSSSTFKHIVPSRALMRLALPIMMVQFCQMGMGSVDTLFAGRYSTVDLAGVALGAMVWAPAVLFINGIISVLTPIAAKKKSEGHAQDAEHAFYLALKIGVAVGLLFFALFSLAPVIISYFSRAPEFVVAGEYLQAVAFSLLVIGPTQALKSRLEARGNVTIVMVSTVIGFMLNIPLNYLLVNGVELGGVLLLSPMGGVGCAVATSAVFLLTSMTILLISVLKHPLILPRDIRVNTPLSLRHFLSLGLPIGLTSCSEVSMFSALALLISPFGVHALGGHQIVLSLTSMAFVLPLSIGMAVTILVSQHHHNNQTLARRYVYQGLCLGLCFMLFTASNFIFFGETLLSLFTADSLVIAAALPLLIIAGSFQFFDASQTILIGSLKGYMDTKVPFYIMAGGSWLIAILGGVALKNILDSWDPAKSYIAYYIALLVALFVVALLLGLRQRRLWKNQGNELSAVANI